MTPEEYQRYKEAEKAHLRKLKELKKAVHTMERQKSVSAAAGKVVEGHDLLEKQKGLVDELAMETARYEARLDVALEGAADVKQPENTEALEEELQRERAQALVKQLKRQMGAENDDADADSHVDSFESSARGNRPAEAGSRRASDDVERSPEDVEQTEERRRHAPATGADPGGRQNAGGPAGDRQDAGRPTGGRDDRPEKTIGRM